MLSLIRQMKVDEILSATGWMSQHKKTCPHGGKFEYDHEPARVTDGNATFRGIKVSVMCKCGARKELGTA